MEKDFENLEAELEALLFVYGEPMELKRLSKSVSKENTRESITEVEIKNALDRLNENYKQKSRGLRIIFSDSKAQLTTKPELSQLFDGLIKEELNETLTPAALETLSIIAYAGPISRSIIDYIRGVNSSFILRMLSMRGLVEKLSDPKRGNAFLYQPSFDLLKYLGISKKEDLPEYQRFKDMVEKLKAN